MTPSAQRVQISQSVAVFFFFNYNICRDGVAKLFQGLTLEVPEIVPFRLTHNMVDAMGPTKYEGFFRRACEVTMNVLREQREPLMR